MVFDPRTSEKHIAPIINEEVDGRNLISYRYGDELAIPLITDDFTVSNENNGIYEKDLFMPLDNIISHSARFSVIVTSDTVGDVEWIIKVNGQNINSEKLSVSDKQTVSRFSTVLEQGLNRIQCVFDGTSDKSLSVKFRVSVALSYNKTRISSKDIGVDHFYIEKIMLNRGDILKFDSLGNIFSNQNTRQEIIEFNKPIAVREINFIRGKPKVLFYYFVRTD